MFYFKRLLVIVLVLGTTSVFAQKVDSIVFSGLKKTHPELLFRFISTQPGQTIDSAQLNRDIQALMNLNIFSSVSWSVETTDADTIINFQANEIITTFPTFSFGSLGDQQFLKFGLTNANFRGRLGIYRLYYLNLDGHSFYYEHEFPYLKNTGFGLSVDLKRVSRAEPLYFGNDQVLYDYRNDFLSVEGFYEFRYNHRFKTRISLFRESFDKSTPAGPDTVDFIQGNKCGLRISHDLGELNYQGCNVSGYSNKSYARGVYTFGDRPFYQVVNTFKYFISFGRFSTIAFRLKAGLSSNNTGAFAPFAVDSYMNIRGVGYKIDRGTGQIVLNLEYRQNIINSDKWGSLQVVAFSDLGTWRIPGGDFSDFTMRQNIKMFAGIGGRLFLVKIYNMTLRADIGFNSMDLSDRGIVLGIGQYF